MSEAGNERKRVWVLHQEAFRAYKTFCERYRDKHPLGNPRGEFTKVGLETRHLQNLFALTGTDFTQEEEHDEKCHRDTVKKFASVVRPGEENASDEFINKKKEKEEADRRRIERRRPVSSVATPSAPRNWRPVRKYVWRKDFANLTIHNATSDASTNTVALKVSAAFSEVDEKIPATETTPAARVALSVKAADILPMLTESTEMVTDTVVGRDLDHEVLTFDTTWKFRLKKQHNGAPLIEQHLCDLQTFGVGPHEAELVLRAKDTDLALRWIVAFENADSKQRAILERILQKMHVGDDGVTIELARGSIGPEKIP